MTYSTKQHSLHADNMEVHGWAVTPNGTQYCAECGIDKDKTMTKDIYEAGLEFEAKQKAWRENVKPLWDAVSDSLKNTPFKVALNNAYAEADMFYNESSDSELGRAVERVKSQNAGWGDIIQFYVARERAYTNAS